MGTKVQGFLEKAERIKATDRLAPLYEAVKTLLAADDSTEDLFEAARMLREIEEVKEVLKAAKEAASEQADTRNEILYALMAEKETRNVSVAGKQFYMTKTNYVQARKELGGTSNPELMAWLDEHDMGELAKKNVNANALRGAINTWLENNPIEVVEDGDFLEGEELYEALGFVPITDPDSGHVVTPEEQLEQRKLEHEALNALVLITEKPYVGVKAAK